MVPRRQGWGVEVVLVGVVLVGVVLVGVVLVGVVCIEDGESGDGVNGTRRV